MTVPPGSYFAVAVPRLGSSVPPAPVTSLLRLQEAASLQTALTIDEAMMLRLEFR